MKKTKIHTNTPEKINKPGEETPFHSFSKGVLSLGAAVFAVCGMVFGGLLTYMWADYTDIVGKQRAEFQKLVEENETAYASVYNQIGTLWLVASGHKSIDDDDRKKLKKSVQDLFLAVDRISEAYPVLTPSANSFVEAMTKLSSSVNNLQGPETAKGFILSTDGFLVEKDRFYARVETVKDEIFKVNLNPSAIWNKIRILNTHEIYSAETS